MKNVVTKLRQHRATIVTSKSTLVAVSLVVLNPPQQQSSTWAAVVQGKDVSGSGGSLTTPAAAGVPISTRTPAVLAGSIPVVVAATETMNTMTNFTICTRCPGLVVTYWGERSLGKIVGMLGEVKRFDIAKTNKAMGMFIRVLLDMSITNDFPDELYFENEYGELVTQAVMYDWKPLWCKK